MRFRPATFFLLTLVLAGCARDGAEHSKYVRDGVRYGVTEGTFRGRWWNYYERGRSFLEGGFYAEAEEDLRLALAGRNRDQLWPRTYGLHFFPEYFPHRELGVVLVQQDRIEEGLAELEQSLEQSFSARAAYYVDRARARIIETNGTDDSSPSVTILRPIPGRPLREFAVEVAGIARDDTFVGAITVNGERVDVQVSAAEVHFSHTVTLAPGGNNIEVTVTDLAGRSSTETIHFEVDHDGPLVSFDDRPANSPTLEGVVYDPAGVESLTIGGRKVSLSTNAEGVASFSFDIGGQELDRPLAYSCEDTLGNSTAGVFTVSDRPMAGNGFPGRSVELAANLSPAALKGWLISAASLDDDVRIDIVNVEDGQQFYRDEIVLSLHVTAVNPITSVTINGRELNTIPGRKSIRISHRERLTAGDNDFHATSTDEGGRSGEVRRRVRRVPSEVELAVNRLGVAFLGDLTTVNSNLSASDGRAIVNELASAPLVNDRFTIVDRDLIQQALAEQELSALLSSRQSKLAMGKLIPADVMFVARIRGDAESIEIVLEGTGTDTGARLTRRIDVAGPYDQIDRLIQDLDLRLVQEFPRVQGTVVAWDDPKVYFDLTQSHGIREYFKCLIVRTETIAPGVEIPKVICQGIINAVGSELSWAEVVPSVEDTGPYAIEIGHYVIIK